MIRRWRARYGAEVRRMGPKNIRSAISILETQPLSGRRVDDHIRELVGSQAATGYLALYRFDPAFDVVQIERIRDQRWAGYRK